MSANNGLGLNIHHKSITLGPGKGFPNSIHLSPMKSIHAFAVLLLLVASGEGKSLMNRLKI
jgi:hypothetical protein